MLMSKVVVSILTILLSGNIAQAKPGEWLNDDLLDDSYIYNSTRAACAPLKPKDLYGGLKFDDLYAGIFPSSDFNALVGAIAQESFLKSTIYLLETDDNENELWLIHSGGFIKAVAECFPDIKDRKRFYRLVSQRKRAGSVFGFGVSILAFSGGVSAVSRISKAATRAINWVTVGAVGASVTYSLWVKIQQRREITDACGFEPKLDCLLSTFNGLGDATELRAELKSAISEDLQNSNLHVSDVQLEEIKKLLAQK